MPDPVRDLYQSHAYPAMSHPSTDPAVTAVAAKLAGLDVTPPSAASILEIGCASGHNLLPLAARWPASRFTGIDFSKVAIEAARENARLAGLANVEFIEADLRDFAPGDGIHYDQIIAHGVYSWVPVDVRQALLDFCAANLPPNGVAFVSYNTLPGWSLRKSIVELTKQLGQRSAAGCICRESGELLAHLAMASGNHTPYARHLTAVLHEMFGKGDDVLQFDDFAPINEPCSFLDFVGHAGRSGMRYLGESQLSEIHPASLAPEALEILAPIAADPHALQQAVDMLTNRTFRRSLLCRADAPVREPHPAERVFDFSIRCPHSFERGAGGARLVDRSGNELSHFDQPLAVAFFSILSETRTQFAPILDVIVRMTGSMHEPPDPAPLARMILTWAGKGLVALRDEPLRFDTTIPAFPNLGTLRLSAARKGSPLVDPNHTPCLLDDARKQQLAKAMDGTRSVVALAALAKAIDPNFNFASWLAHLAARGMFTR